MRWMALAIVGYLLLLVQVSLANVLSIPAGSLGRIVPDLLAMLTVFVALRASDVLDAMLAAWVLGLAVDLSVGGGGPDATVVGPMALAYSVAAAVVFQLRDVLFRDRMLAQVVLAGLFSGIAHGLWVLVQWVVVLRKSGWSIWPLWGVAVLLSTYTAVISPLVYWLLQRCQRWLIARPTDGRSWP